MTSPQQLASPATISVKEIREMAQKMAQEMAQEMAQKMAQEMAQEMAQKMAQEIAQKMAQEMAQKMASKGEEELVDDKERNKTIMAQEEVLDDFNTIVTKNIRSLNKDFNREEYFRGLDSRLLKCRMVGPPSKRLLKKWKKNRRRDEQLGWTPERIRAFEAIQFDRLDRYLATKKLGTLKLCQE